MRRIWQGIKWADAWVCHTLTDRRMMWITSSVAVWDILHQRWIVAGIMGVMALTFGSKFQNPLLRSASQRRD